MLLGQAEPDWDLMLTNEPLPQAWLHGGAPVTHVWAMDTEFIEFSCLYDCIELLFVWPVT